MGQMVGYMFGLSEMANFASFPKDAQLACCSISYGTTQMYSPLLKAIGAQDWSLAAEVYKDPGWDAAKSEAHKDLFRSAARAQGKSTKPFTLITAGSPTCCAGS